LDNNGLAPRMPVPLYQSDHHIVSNTKYIIRFFLLIVG
jgi:hypothetical protein